MAIFITSKKFILKTPQRIVITSLIGLRRNRGKMYFLYQLFLG